MGKFIIMKGQSAAKVKNQKKMDERLIGKTFNKIKVLSFSHAKDSRKYYNVLCLRCNAESTMRSDRFNGTQKLETCSKCRQQYAALKTSEKKLPKEEKRLSLMYSGYKSNAKNRKLTFDMTLKDFKGIVSKNCYYCGLSNNIGIDRVDNSIGYKASNMVPCCTICNMMKKTLDVNIFLEHCRTITDFKQGSTTISKESTLQVNGSGKGEIPKGI